KLGRDADAANTYERYRRSPAAETARILDVDRLILQLSARLGRLRIEGAAGARLFIDGIDTELTAPAGYWVWPGQHRVMAERETPAAQKAQVVVAAGEEKVVTLAAESVASAPPNRAPSHESAGAEGKGGGGDLEVHARAPERTAGRAVRFGGLARVDL